MESLNLQIEIFLLLLTGYVLAKINLIDKHTRKQLTNLVLYVTLPASIILSFDMDVSAEILKSCIVVFLASVGIQVLYWISMKLIYGREKDKRKRVVLQYGTMVSNAGFMGMPIAQAAFGAQGLLYASIFLIPQRVCMWSTGLALFAGSSSRKETFRKVITHPCILALFIGVAIMGFSLAGFALPASIQMTLKAIANCTTALSMIVVGTILSDVPFSEFIHKKALFYSFVRLILLPGIIWTILSLAGMNGLALSVCVLESAMPAPSTVVMLANTYDGDTKLASVIVFVSTILSLITLPIWMSVL